MKYLLGIDFGGGASKATLLSEEGIICATHTTEYATNYPKPGYAEQNPDDWVKATCENIRGVLEKSQISPEDICAVSLDAATHTAVILDEDFRVIRPAIYWTDTRSTEEVSYLKEHFADVIERQVLHQPDTIWSLPELLWIKNHEPDAWARTKKILFAKDYVRHQLTGDYVTDYIEAEGSMMFDVNTMEWSKELCGVLEIEPSMLPKIVKPTDVAVYVERGAADVGIAGRDILLEYEPDVYELLDLGIGVCRMCIAGYPDFYDDTDRPLRVATKFPRIARAYYEGKGREIDIIKLHGSIELAPILDLSDVICDIVETGSTLKENNLVVLEEVEPVSARFIANRIAWQFKHNAIEAMRNALEAETEDGK